MSAATTAALIAVSECIGAVLGVLASFLAFAAILWANKLVIQLFERR